jgi:hypothetical protein
MFRFNHHHQELVIRAFLKLLLLKQSESSVIIYRCGQFGGVAKQRYILTDDSDCFSKGNFSKAQIARSLMIVIKPKHVGAFLM